MFRQRSIKIVTAWIATVAILMAALMPSISHAVLAGSHQPAWAEVCSMDGMKMVQVGTAETPVSSIPGKLALHAEHCPFCSLHAGALGMPPVHEFTVPAATLVAGPPALFYQSPAPQFIWSAAQSRAPPSIS